MRIAVLISLLLLATKISAACENEISILSRWLSDTPEKDAKHSLEQGHGFYLAIYGFAVSIPGISKPEELQVLEDRSYAALPGTTDAPCSDEHRNLIERAKEYAAQYNATIRNEGGAT